MISNFRLTGMLHTQGRCPECLGAPQGFAPHMLHVSRLVKDTLMPDAWAAPCDIFNVKGIQNWIEPWIKVKHITLTTDSYSNQPKYFPYFNRFSLPCASVSSLFTPVTGPVMVCPRQGCILASHPEHAGIDCSTLGSPIRKERRLTETGLMDGWMDLILLIERQTTAVRLTPTDRQLTATVVCFLSVCWLEFRCKRVNKLLSLTIKTNHVMCHHKTSVRVWC